MMGTVPLLSGQLVEFDDATLAIHQYEYGERAQSWGYSIRQRRDGSFKLDVSGRGTENWLPALCGDLFHEGINILSGHVYRAEAGSIRGSLVLETSGRSGSPLEIDVMDCLRSSGSTGRSDSISLSRYSIEPSELHRGSITLEIEGLDRRGFLQTFFEALEPLELTVVEARVATVSRMISDRFWFQLPEGGFERVNEQLVQVLEPLIDCYWAA
jgi:UTP:GlnB (protein PII) uridylyltransferase